MTKPVRCAAWLLSILFSALPLFAQNPIQLENMKQGDENWQFYSQATTEIEGYASATSVNRGEQIKFYVNTTEPQYTFDIYRMGWYGGAGARHMLGPITRTGVRQVIPTPDPTTGLIECNWVDPYVLTIPNSADPTDWCSGIYLVRLNAPSVNKQKYIVFVVRDDARISTHYFQNSATTSQAYNNWGGKSLYPFNSTNETQASMVSFNRPYSEGVGTGTFLWRWEYNMVRFMEREGYDVTYCTNIDTARRGTLLKNHRDFLSIGHDEYWSWEMRQNVEAARDAGINIGFFGANTCYWQIRLGPSKYDSSQADRTIIAYKENYTQDPYYSDGTTANDYLVTTNWRSAPVRKPEDAFVGTWYVYDSPDPNNPVDGDIVIDDVTTEPWVFANTGLTKGSKLPRLLGYEVDAIGSHSPSDIVRLGHSPFTNIKVSPPATQYSDMTIYTVASGAKVFSAGSIQFLWGVDDWNEGAPRVNPAVQQMVRNLLARFAGSSAQNDCQFALSPAAVNAGATAGSTTVSVTSYCNWTASSNAAWLTVTPSSGNGSGTLTISWTQNNSQARTGTITVGNRTLTVTQATGCTMTINPTSASYTASGGSGSITISMSSAQCTWTATDDANWITFSNPPSGTGNGSGTLTYSVAANPGVARTGTITINGQDVSIAQQNGCVYNVSPTSFNISGNAATLSVTITTDATCHWAAESHSPWLAIVSADGGAGSTTLTFSATRNTSGASRTGFLVVAGVNVFVTQAVPTARAAARDLTGDGYSDIWWRNMSTGQNYAYFIAGRRIIGQGTIDTVSDMNWRIVGRGDFDGDGISDVLWRNFSTGSVAMYLMSALQKKSIIYLPTISDLNWVVVGVGDFNGDGKADILWRHSQTGQNYLWFMNGGQKIGEGAINTIPDQQWKIVGVGDFNGDGRADILWRHFSSGQVYIYLMNGATKIGEGVVNNVADLRWTIVGVGDLNGDGRDDIVWRHSTTGENYLYMMNGASIQSGGNLRTATDPNWRVAQIGDFNGDGLADILWRHGSTGEDYMWFMNGTAIASEGQLDVVADLNWKVQ